MICFFKRNSNIKCNRNVSNKRSAKHNRSMVKSATSAHKKNSRNKPYLNTTNIIPRYDKFLIIALSILVVIGFIMISSASMAISERQFGDSFHYAVRQIIYLFLGGLILSIVTRIRIVLMHRFSTVMLLFGLLLLLLVIIPGIGHHVNSSSRWIVLGPVGLQVSEYVKLAVIVYLSSYLVRKQDEIRTKIVGFVKPMFILGVIGVLLLLEPDFGAAVVITITSLSMMYLAGVRLGYFVILLILVITALCLLAISSPYRLLRLTSFLNPWAHQFSSGYQLTQSLIAFGRGGLSGVGLGDSIQKLFYLPEAHTDFLFAVLSEELGLIGVLVVIFSYVLVVVRGLLIGRRSQLVERHGAGYLAYGISIWFGIQAIVNMGVNSGMLPTKGLTLPLLSYGGSSLLIMFFAIALLLRVDYETRLLRIEGR